jgi:hypothetical protein
VRAAQLNRQAPMKPLAVMAFVLALVAVSNAADLKPVDWSKLRARDSEAFPIVLDQLKVSKLFRLAPFATWDNPPSSRARFHEWVVAIDGVGVPIDASSGRSLILSMRTIVDHPDNFASACFEPHHGAILTDGRRRFDVVLCFKCSRYEVFNAEGKRVWAGSFSTVRNEVSKWDEALRAAGL